MKPTIYSRIILTAFILSALLHTGCTTTHVGASHRPIIDGRTGVQYERDLRECRSIASQRNYLNDRDKQNTLVGAAVGGVLGRNIVSGAIVGAAVAATGSTILTRSERKNIVINCMNGRGYNTLE
jgi:uncharacterized protein YcfJ